MGKNDMVRCVLRAVAVMSLVVGMVSCGTGKSHTARAVYKVSPSKSGTSSGVTAKRHVNLSAALTPSGHALLKEADSWIGTPYIYGGNDRRGVDCSGFVLQVYNNALNIKLPRTSHKQHEYCNRITRGELQPGDLVFFTVRGGGSVGHVGIYVGGDEMVHASTSKGVIVSSLSDNYYRTNYYASGRVAKYGELLAAETPMAGRKKNISAGKAAESGKRPADASRAAGNIVVKEVVPPPATIAAMSASAVVNPEVPDGDSEPEIMVMTDFFE